MAIFEPSTDARTTFKDCAAQDITDTFFNADEHAEEHLVDGKSAIVVLDESDTKQYSGHWGWGKNARLDDALYRSGATLYIKVSDYGAKPKAGKEIVLDEGTNHKRTYRILHCKEQQGVYEMSLERLKQ